MACLTEPDNWQLASVSIRAILNCDCQLQITLGAAGNFTTAAL